ncbi:4Fe-4S binding protein [Methanobacterium alkalithermotolerans]|uniref:4Fe-4S binding protein n=1 Tax=Methanobacterium alkalithermotolerans TaxID=2731220 RepID=A0A8T8K658_9EURY|nr:EFR1 family ferrodoxin [Methanobacterium alkalithermotolerans]QUH23409.1 4Fe-4S binding protein [Methanobacterium alkalithermotolerans]
MINDKIDFYYFSGTGNTYLVVHKMKEVWEKHGLKVNLFPLENSNPEKINLNNVIGLGFPVAEQSTYHFVWDFIKRLPESPGTAIFMVDTMGSFSGGIVGPLKKLLTGKGYHPLGACEIIMPSNIFYIAPEKKCQEKIEKGLLKAEHYALSLLKGTARWGRVPLISDAMYLASIFGLALTRSRINQNLLPLTTYYDLCQKCRICVKLCPVGNRKIEKNEYPQHGLKCEYCLRCASFCPYNAIKCPFNYKGKTYKAVEARVFLERK